MTQTKFNRFKDAVWFCQTDTRCIIGGAGGISSWLTLLLSRAGFEIIVFDFDTLEEHNLGGQIFKRSQIGMKKVDALFDVVKEFTDTEISTFDEKYTDESLCGAYMFAGFDNMKARKDMYKRWKDYLLMASCPISECIFIDGRLLAEQMQIICITGDDVKSMERYEAEYLFDDADVAEASCTFRQTSHAAAIIAGLMTGLFTNHIANIVNNDKGRFLPFYTEYFIPLGYYVTD